MENRFNLIDERWIPVENKGLMSLRDVFTDKACKKIYCRPLDRIALMKLLLAIGQSAFTPKDDEEWLNLGIDGFIKKISDYLSHHHDKFYLYGEEPFLQYNDLNNLSQTKKSYGDFIPNVATGNTTIVTHWQEERNMTDPEKARLLIRLMSLSFGGKKVDNSFSLNSSYKGKKKGGKPGPGIGNSGFLHSFYGGNSIVETVYFNMLTLKDLESLPMFEGIGMAPWVKMPKCEDDEIAEKLKNTLMGRLIPLSRFCYLSDNFIKITEGIAHLNYKDGICDPSICVVNDEKEIKAIWASPDKNPWRDLESLLSFINTTSNSKCVCNQLRLAIERIKKLDTSFSIWSGGVKLTSNSGEQYLSGSDDEVESEVTLPASSVQSELWFNSFCDMFNKLNRMAGKLKKSVKIYLENFKNKNEELPKRAEMDFWQYVDMFSQQIVESCSNSEDEVENLRKKFFVFSMGVFDKYCPCNTPRQIEAWVKCKAFLCGGAKNGSK